MKKTKLSKKGNIKPENLEIPIGENWETASNLETYSDEKDLSKKDDTKATKAVKIIISCGGTGGHIYPGLVLADAIQEHIPNSEILFVGAKDKMEIKIVTEAGFEIKGLNIRGLQRKSWIENLTLPYRILSSIWQSRKIIKDFKPSIVIGTGGYASAPILFTASLLKIPTIIHEQNAIPGLANIILSKFVDKICVSYESAADALPKSKVIFTGTPIRKDVLNNNKEESYIFFDLDPTKKCLLIFGGSLGTQSINDCILKSLELIISKNIQLIWITGEKYYDKVIKNISESQKKTIRVYPFLKEIGKAYAVADVVISRGGAVAIAELCAVQKPVIFIPSPNITNDHQTKNIEPLVTEGAVICVKDQNVNFHLVKQAIWLLENVIKQQTMTQKIKKWSYPNAADNIVKEIVRMIEV